MCDVGALIGWRVDSPHPPHAAQICDLQQNSCKVGRTFGSDDLLETKENHGITI